MDTSSLRYARLVQESGLSPIHREIIRMVGREKYVLDVGCSTGYLAQALRCEAGCIVDGVELDPEAGAIAKAHLRHLYLGSLEDPEVLARIHDRFDVIIFADVLEHLARPEVVLRACRALLRPDGYALISLPNIAHWDIRRNLFFRGQWQYTPTGILDHTHLRFYTFHSVRDLVQAAGFQVVGQRGVIAWTPFERRLSLSGIGRRLVDSRAFQFYKQQLVERYPNLFAFQILLQVIPQDA